MARFLLLAYIFASLLASTNANPLTSQQSIIGHDDTVRIKQGWSWSDCGQSTDGIQIESITVSPDPPKPGQNLTVTVKAYAQEEVEEGAYANVVVKLGLIKLLQKQFDLCEEARNAQTSVQCPVNKGTYVVEQTVALPKEIPQAKFTINARGYTVNEDDLFCVDLKVDFMKRPFPMLSLGW
ncbi:ML domain-containing protein [Multifurca ochricompacta]|uniref:Phosphatidylglycerol/phosphatidylinositol transfer protein n=1 Tax=Multifurca ochricompacta TaxID=376703 RepID=A0AAD4QRQ2_9AGAM|nr:ML domain-containing protein [Multifurca ochricompacta]